jgi:hypothetical protein
VLQCVTSTEDMSLFCVCVFTLLLQSSHSPTHSHIGGGVLKGGLDERRVFELLRVLQPPRVSDASPSAADTAGQEGM